MCWHDCSDVYSCKDLNALIRMANSASMVRAQVLPSRWLSIDSSTVFGLESGGCMPSRLLVDQRKCWLTSVATLIVWRSPIIGCYRCSTARSALVGEIDDVTAR